MHPEVLPAKETAALKKMAGIARRNRLTLAGGTALALQIGHRISRDLDFFTDRRFEADRIYGAMRRLGMQVAVERQDDENFVAQAEGARVSVFRYPYPFIAKSSTFMGVSVAGIPDIAAMKIIAICQRGKKRDFIDLYFILQDMPARKIARALIQRYGAGLINPVHIGKALVYFRDAEDDPEPAYCGNRRLKWETVKKFFAGSVRQTVLDIQEELRNTTADASPGISTNRRNPTLNELNLRQ